MITSRGLLMCALLLSPAAAVAQEVTAPVWPKPDLFWYRRTTDYGNLWIKVDALHGAKEPLVDHQRLAIELSLRSGNEFTPMTLPLADPASQFIVKYDGRNAYIQEGAMAIEFILGGQHWRCDLQIKWNWNLVPPTDYECLPRRAIIPGQSDGPVPADNAPRVSPDGKWEAFIQNHNVAVRSRGSSSAPTMLSTDGTPTVAYHLGSIRWSRDSQSLAAFKVDSEIWRSDSVTGNVKKQVARGEWKVPK